MKDFFKYLLATITGIILVNVIIFILFFIMISALSTVEKPQKIKANSVLHLKLDYEITERTDDNPFKSFSTFDFKTKKQLGLNDILFNIKKASTDSNIKAIFLDVSTMSAGLATIEEIRQAIIQFRKESKKPVLAYADYYSQLNYYLCTAADKIYLNPQGVVELKGLVSQTLFLKNALEKLGIEPILIRHGKFKSAGEMFMLDKMSPENKEQTLAYVKSLWDYMLSEIAIQRQIPVERLNVIADSLLSDEANNSLKLGLVDKLMYYDEFLNELKKITGHSTINDIPMVSLATYSQVPAKFEPGKKDKIAIIYAVGQIDLGENDEDKMGGNEMADIIREVRNDKDIKAVIFRVNSPGGSALASEVIWREIELTKKEKPVIVSMSDVAASGGYYISCPANVIVANPTTITGSIGVFGILWNGQKLLNEKLGITIDGVETNLHSSIGSAARPIKPYEQMVIQKSVDNIYNVFVSRVSEGRKKTIEEVDSIGQGRVWSGIHAKEIGLVDELGGLEKAIEIAKQKAKITGKARIIEYPKKLPFFEQLLKDMQENASTSIIHKTLGTWGHYFKTLKNLELLQGVQARMPYDIYFE
ncbi:MAG: signal peptide peptidase SppA [Bacteroidales bacterium]|nr:signal peptide peptidase SppA [Bacteroidales bacterium]